jgi:hypothetical protein
MSKARGKRGREGREENVVSLLLEPATNPLNSDRLLVGETRARRTTLASHPEVEGRGLMLALILDACNTSDAMGRRETTWKGPGGGWLLLTL